MNEEALPLPPKQGDKSFAPFSRLRRRSSRAFWSPQTILFGATSVDEIFSELSVRLQQSLDSYPVVAQHSLKE